MEVAGALVLSSAAGLAGASLAFALGLLAGHHRGHQTGCEDGYLAGYDAGKHERDRRLIASFRDFAEAVMTPLSVRHAQGRGAPRERGRWN